MKTFVHRVSAFLRTSYRSLFDMTFYRGIRHQPLGGAVSYLAVLIAALWLAPLMVGFFVGARQGLDQLRLAVRKHVPPGAVFEFKDGRLSSNLADPIVVQEPNSRAVLIVNSASSSLKLADDEFGVAIGAEGLTQKRSPGHSESVSFKSVDDRRFSRGDVEDGIRRYAPWLLLIVALITLVAMSLILAGWHGAAVFGFGLAFFLLTRLLKKPMRYPEAVVIAAYAATGPIILKSMMSWTGADSGLIPAAFHWILLGFILYDWKRGETGNVERHQTSSGGPNQVPGK
jgi:hypothetical protein